jgi:hypothetical protein
LDKLQKQIVGDMLKGDGRNGKQSNNYWWCNENQDSRAT